MKFVRLACMGAQTPCPPLSDCETYDEKLERFFSYFISYADSLSYALRQLGVEAREIVFDCEELQQAWAKERGIEGRGFEIVLAQLRELKPDTLFLQDIYGLPKGVHKQIKTIVPSIKRLILFRGFPFVDRALIDAASAVDLLLVGSPRLLQPFQKEGFQPNLFYHYFDDRLLPLVSSEKKEDFIFCGSSGLGHGMGHAARFLLLEECLKRKMIKAWLEEIPPTYSSPFDYFKKKIRASLVSKLAHRPFAHLRYLPSQKIRALFNEESTYRLEGYPSCYPLRPLRKRFPNAAFPPLYGSAMYRKLSEARVTLNKHGNCAASTADNIRLFQATGMQTALLTDHATNLPDLFEPDSEVVTYRSLDECLEKAQFLLDHPKVREEIARSGHQRTLKEHLAKHRALQLLQWLRELDK